MKLTLEQEIMRTPRVVQASSMFDVAIGGKSIVQIDAELDLESDRDWQIGLIVGPSGAGKTSLARGIWGDRVITLDEQRQWDEHKSILDDFPESMGIKEIVGLLTSVGFGSPPSWLRPFRALSTGEQFRVSIARALAETDDETVVVDEFTSVVDRQVAQVASHAIAKAVRRRQTRFVGVSCHYDIIDWLQPDWVYRVDTNDFRWGCLQPRPALSLDIAPVDRSAWVQFRPHHYLSSSLQGAAHCWGAFTADGECVAFNAFMRFPHAKAKNIMIGHRLVVLPDYQGLGIGGRFDDYLGQWLWERGERYHKVISHPALVNYFSRSPRWRRISRNQMNTGPRSKVSKGRDARILTTHSFEYVAPKKGSRQFGSRAMPARGSA